MNGEGQMEKHTLPRLLTAQEVSEQTGIPLWRVYHLVRSGGFPVVRIGRSYRFAAEAVLVWIRKASTPETNEEA